MKISLHWLREWVSTGDDIPALSHALTMAGLEVEGVESLVPEMSGVVVAEVVSVEKHPDAEKLSVCQVNSGTERLQIVCGAANVRAGMKAPLAKVGARLPGGMEIKRAKLRGIESYGMLCSAREIGLSDEHSGLLDLPSEATIGADIQQALALNDVVLELNLTPNRGDCMSVLGVAREVGAIRGVQLCGPAMGNVESVIQDTFPVAIESPEACRTFAGRVVRGIDPRAKSPLWLRERLRRAGVRSISAVVDVTNYVMLELGQPMHAYDLAQLESRIVVRHARAGETLQLLDDRVVELTPDVLVIADAGRVLGLAGIMGGAASGISDGTTDVFLEVAYFEPSAIAGRGRRYGLVTDASQRFERGVDPTLQARAIERATQLLISICGGRAGPSVVTRSNSAPMQRSPVVLRHARVKRLLGIELGKKQIETILRNLGMALVQTQDGWQVTPPTWRFDIAIEEDLIEEVGRLYGYDKIPPQDVPAAAPAQMYSESLVPASRAADLLADRGYQETINYSFVDPKLQAAFEFGLPTKALANPLSADLAEMRVSLWPALARVLGENQRRQQSRVRFFELGRGFWPEGEVDLIAGVAFGPAAPTQWDAGERAVDFFDVKADVEALTALTGRGETFSFERARHPALHPGQSAQVKRGEAVVGWIGAMHPKLLKRLDLHGPVILFELRLDHLLATRVPEFTEISKFPSIRRDLAVVVDEDVTSEALRKSAAEAAGQLLQSATVLSVYRGTQIQEGKKSIALALVLQDTSRTLTDSDADSIIAQVASHLRERVGAAIRDK